MRYKHALALAAVIAALFSLMGLGMAQETEQDYTGSVPMDNYSIPPEPMENMSVPPEGYPEMEVPPEPMDNMSINQTM